MLNAFKRLLGTQNKTRADTGLQRWNLAQDQRCLAAWRGILPQTNRRYSLIVRHLRRLPGEERAPFRAFDNATHDFSIWYAHVDRPVVNQFLLFHEQIDLGSEHINAYTSDVARWRSPDGFNAAKRLVDNAAIKVGEKLAETLTTAKTRYLVRSGIVDLYYAMAIEDVVSQLEHLRRNPPEEELTIIQDNSIGMVYIQDVVFKAGDRVLIMGTKDKAIATRFRQLNPHVNADGLFGRWGNVVDAPISSRVATVRIGAEGKEKLIKVPKVLLKLFEG